MTEREWLTCGSRTFMRFQLRQRRYSPLRWVQFNLACIERVRELIGDERCIRMIDVLGHLSTASHVYAAHASTGGEAGVREAIRELWRQHADPQRGARIAAARAVLTAKWPTFATSEMVALAVGRWRYGYSEERIAHCSLLRDIFGNPFRPVAFAPGWRTDTAVTLARTMYESRDFSAMPILADALQDAGCDNDDILAHCRDTSFLLGEPPAGSPKPPPATHVRGCWVVDGVLGKS